MKELIERVFEGNSIRTSFDEKGNPWFVAIDVMKVLDLKYKNNALRKLDQDERGLIIMETKGGPQELATINESGLYALTLVSRKTAAKKFRKWVTSVLVPEIRKGVSINHPPYIEMTPAERLLEMMKNVVEQERQIILQQSQINSVSNQMIGVLVKQEAETLTADESTQLHRAVARRAKEIGHVKVNGWIKKAIKERFLEFSSARKFDQIARRDLQAAINLAKSYEPPAYILAEIRNDQAIAQQAFKYLK